MPKPRYISAPRQPEHSPGLSLSLPFVPMTTSATPHETSLIEGSHITPTMSSGLDLLSHTMLLYLTRPFVDYQPFTDLTINLRLRFECTVNKREVALRPALIPDTRAGAAQKPIIILRTLLTIFPLTTSQLYGILLDRSSRESL
jgi:hypothetical protein